MTFLDFFFKYNLNIIIIIIRENTTFNTIVKKRTDRKGSSENIISNHTITSTLLLLC